VNGAGAGAGRIEDGRSSWFLALGLKTWEVGGGPVRLEKLVGSDVQINAHCLNAFVDATNCSHHHD